MLSHVQKVGNHQTSGSGIFPAALLECGHILRGDSFVVGQEVNCEACDPREDVHYYDEVRRSGTPISRDELLAALTLLQEQEMGDGHGEADSVLLDYINDAEIRAAFLKIGRYYD